MLRTVIRKLRLIEYYSATRQRTAWTRAAERSLLLTIPLAVAGMLISEALITESILVQQVQGKLTGPRGGPLVAEICDPDLPMWGSEPNPWGEFSIQFVDRRNGWPLASMIIHSTPEVDLDDFTQVGTQRGVTLGADHPAGTAIERALENPRHREALIAWREQDSLEAHRSYVGSIVGVVLWWVLLSFASFVGIGATRYQVMIFKGRRTRRAAGRIARGRSAPCGDDLRGLEFNERCPECGSLIR